MKNLQTMKNLRSCVLLLFLLSQTGFLQAGGIRGVIQDQNGNPLEFATIFVESTGSGTVANESGFFELRLSPGTYTVVFQHLGHTTITRSIPVGNDFTDVEIVLQEQTLELKTIEVYEGREDPAYTVMRKAIAKASYHRQQLDSYEAEVYMKGSGRLLKSPRILRKAIEKEGVDSTVAFTTESVSRIKYTRPSTFEETVISIHTQGDDNDTSPNQYINGSFYEPTIGGAISPLSPKAFGYYKFNLEGYFVDRGYGVNKIKVTPRSRGEDVFEGYIYIVEDLWNIYSLDLKTYYFGIGFLIEQVYAPIKEEAWLPVNHVFNVEGKFLGFAFEYKYLATVSNYTVELNPDLDHEFDVIDEKINKELAAEIEKRRAEDPKKASAEEKLASGEELTRKDLRKLLKSYEKEERKQQEEPEVVENTSFHIDSMAYKRDSLYWQEIRPVPLTAHEVKGYERFDSLAKIQSQEATEEDSLMARKNKRKNGGKFSVFDIITGYSFKVGENQTLGYSNFIDKVQFNPVEGWVVFNKISYTRKKIKEDNRFQANFYPRYAFARNKFTGKGNLIYTYGSRLERSQIALEGGRYMYQYNAANPIVPLFSMYINLVQGRNLIRLYEKDYLKLSLSHKTSENVTWRAGVEWAQRYTLENNTSQTWFPKPDRSYESNIPVNDEVDLPLAETEKALFAYIGVEARPWQKYRIRNDKKQAIDNTSPTLSFFYKKGFSGIAESVVNYDQIDFTIKHRFKVGARGRVDVKANAGMFLNNEYVGFVDFKHFQGNRIALVAADPVGSFRLLDYYKHSTQEEYAALHVHYQFRKFLLTQIPEVWMFGIKENLFVNYLATPTSQNYVELGYSLDKILGLFRIEAAVAFQDGKYLDWGILLGVTSSIGGISFN